MSEEQKNIPLTVEVSEEALSYVQGGMLPAEAAAEVQAMIDRSSGRTGVSPMAGTIKPARGLL